MLYVFTSIEPQKRMFFSGGITIKAPVQESSFIQPETLSTSLKYVPQETDFKCVLRCFSESEQHNRKVYLKIWIQRATLQSVWKIFQFFLSIKKKKNFEEANSAAADEQLNLQKRSKQLPHSITDWANSICLWSQKHQRWKRPSRSSSTIINLTIIMPKPYPQVSHADDSWTIPEMVIPLPPWAT